MKYIIGIAVLLLAACSSLPNSRVAETQYGEFTYYLSGNKKPTIIFESGLADDMTSWDKVIKRITPEFEAFAYNRAGLSGSKSTNIRRNAANIVKELNALLEKSNLPPPYILVGHSLGGGYLELFAKTFPHNVSAMVLVDPNSSKYPAAVEGEIIGFTETHSQINAIDEFPDIPLVVISALKERKNSTIKEKKAAALYLKMHKDLTKRSSNSKHIICETCNHDIHVNNPQLVVESLMWVLDKVNESNTHYKILC